MPLFTLCSPTFCTLLLQLLFVQAGACSPHTVLVCHQPELLNSHPRVRAGRGYCIRHTAAGRAGVQQACK